MLPAYSIMLGFLALLGFMAVAAGVKTMPQFADGFKQYGTSFAIPALMLASFPAWFAGVAFAAIAIGAVVPAAIMAIAAANIFTRDIAGPMFTQLDKGREALMAKLFAIFMIVAAVLFVLGIPTSYAVQLQLLGGMWIIQTFPAIVFSLYTRFFNGWALLIGWAAGMVTATWLVYLNHFLGSIWPFHIFGMVIPSYIALATVLLNAIIALVLSVPLNALAPDRARDRTVAAA
jgi:SSS family solute:Na+ symporter